MGEYQKKLIELLDKEGLMDKELKFGCLVNYFWDSFRGNEEENYFIISHCTDFVICFNRTRYFQSGETCSEGISKFNKKEIINNENYETIGQYFLGNVLQLLNNNGCGMQINNNIIHIRKQFIYSQGNEIIILDIDITKPPMEYSESQNKELVEFMEKVLDSNK